MDKYIIIGLAIIIPIISVILGIEIAKWLYHKNQKRLEEYFANQQQQLVEISEKYKVDAKKYTDDLVKEKQKELSEYEQLRREQIAKYEKAERQRIANYEAEEVQKINNRTKELQALQLQMVQQTCQNKLIELENSYDLKNAQLETNYQLKEEKLEDKFNKRQNEINTTLRSIQNKLLDAHLHKQALYQDMQREQQVKEQEEFFSIQLSENNLEDIHFLQSIKSRLTNPMLIDKFIFDAYISKPVLELARRVLQSRKISGVYKITSKKTGLVYIGQSTDVGARWKNHILSACGLDGVADSIFQRTLKKEGIENFTFELLEECKKEELHDKEKYWIEFFESNKYGLNMKV